jgi:hypothetical protein
VLRNRYQMESSDSSGVTFTCSNRFITFLSSGLEELHCKLKHSIQDSALCSTAFNSEINYIHWFTIFWKVNHLNIITLNPAALTRFLSSIITSSLRSTFDFVSRHLSCRSRTVCCRLCFSATSAVKDSRVSLIDCTCTEKYYQPRWNIFTEYIWFAQDNTYFLNLCIKLCCLN